jgi:hypothetical protein
VPQLEFNGSIAICASRSPSTGVRGGCVERKGERALRQGSRRVETARLAAKLRHDGFLVGCTFRVSRLTRGSRKSATARVAAGQ